MRALANSPEERYPSAEAMKQALEACGRVARRSNAPRSQSVSDGPLQPDQVLLDRYRILGIIAISGRRAVYQAHDLHAAEADRLCAVKEVPNLAEDQQLREQAFQDFERRAAILTTLRHPAIPHIYDYFTVGDRAYLVMEYIQGKDLEAVVNSTEDFLPVEQVRGWAIEICDALSYLHNHKPEPIVFRDMRPSHVMVDQHQRVRLIDFGIAKTLAKRGGERHIMIDKGLIYVVYTAPETNKWEVVIPASDLYSLGATLYHLLTRRHPYREPPLFDHSRPIREANPEVSEQFAAVVMRALADSPEDRFPSAEAMKQALEAAIEGPGKQEDIQADKGQKNIVVVSSEEGVVPAWRFKVEDAICSRPLVRDGIVYVSAHDSNLWALSSKDDSLLWKFATDGGMGASPIYSGGTIFVGLTDQRLYAVDAQTGNRQWAFKTGGKIYSTACAAAGLIFFGSDDGKLYALKSGRKALERCGHTTAWYQFAHRRWSKMTPCSSALMAESSFPSMSPASCAGVSRPAVA